MRYKFENGNEGWAMEVVSDAVWQSGFSAQPAVVANSKWVGTTAGPKAFNSRFTRSVWSYFKLHCCNSLTPATMIYTIQPKTARAGLQKYKKVLQAQIFKQNTLRFTNTIPWEILVMTSEDALILLLIINC
jgi:hypothetical protein